MTQVIENTNFRTLQTSMTDGQLITIPWPNGFVAGTVAINANSTTIAGLVHARSGGSPFTLTMGTPLANLVITSSDLSVSPPASGTGKLTVGRSATGLQLHAGGEFTTSVTFLG